MKRLIVVLLIGLTACSPADFHDTEGQAYRYADFDGKWLVINYWATWCAPCIKEIPELIRLNDQHDNIVVFGVNYDEPGPEEMADAIAKMKITFPVYQTDPYRQFGIERPAVLPTTVIVDPRGELTEVLVGPQTEASLLAVMGMPEPGL